MCGFGWLMPALPWMLIVLVWAYVIVWMFVLDVAKLGLYRLLENRARHREKHLDIINQPLHPQADR